MTHSLHRRGDLESLSKDYVLLATPAIGYNHEGSEDKLRRILEIIFDIGPVNIGSYATGTIYSGVSCEEIKVRLSEAPRVRCVFSDRDKIKEAIRRIREEDLGMSITVSGLIDEVLKLAKELGIKPHSINLSLDIWGKTDELPPEDVLEFVTMCGHGLISRHLVEMAIEQVRSGRWTPERAARVLAPPCVCGIFNPDRAARLFEKYVSPAAGTSS